MSKIAKLLKSQEGQGTMEYAGIVLIVIAAVVALNQPIGAALTALFARVSAAIGTIQTPAG